MICASITENDIDSMIKVANSIDSDLVEIRLDYLKNFDNIEKLREIKKPIMSTCMPEWEAGLFKGSDEERVEILSSALDFSKYVTIELKTDTKLRNKLLMSAAEKSVKTIVSYHDFKSTPTLEEILKILKKEENTGADIAKVAFMAKNYSDVLNLMFALIKNDLKIPVIVLSMGEIGRISRIFGPLLGSYITFASPYTGRESAPGQLSVDEIKSILEILKR